MNGLPYFAFYASDFLSGVAAMPLEDRGAYITLLCHQWVNGSIPDDLPACVRICGGGTVSERVLDKFQNVKGTGTRLNARLEKEREKCMKAKEKAKKRKTKWNERNRNATGTRSGTIPDTSTERLGSDSDSILPLGKRDIQESGDTKPKTKKPIQVESMPIGLEPLLLDFNVYLKNKGTGSKKATPRGVELDLKHMTEWGLEKARFILEKAVASNYQGLNDYGDYEKQRGASQQPGGMNSERKFDPVAHKALMAHRFDSLPKGPEDE